MMMGACLAGVALLGTWASIQWAPGYAANLALKLEDANIAKFAAADTQFWSAFGAIIGTILAAIVGDWLGRRVTYALLCVASLAATYWLFQHNTTFNMQFLVSVFVAGGVTASFYGWLPLYLPELFPTRVRAIAQGFAFNFGRILAAIGVLQTGTLQEYIGNNNLATALTAMSMVYLIGPIVIWFVPETKGQPLPE
jgi:MFS family permease